MDKLNDSDRWETYFCVFLNAGKEPAVAALLADDALSEQELRYRYREDLPFEELRNPNSSRPPNGSIYYTVPDPDIPEEE